mmetsp:Transcript_16296/g.26047  ORF Transcript_16296/g.26047 Transcript_16296/m.26047 type:complete len:230 (-) Transcript_16296:565-1254(-)
MAFCLLRAAAATMAASEVASLRGSLEAEIASSARPVAVRSGGVKAEVTRGSHGLTGGSGVASSEWGGAQREPLAVRSDFEPRLLTTTPCPEGRASKSAASAPVPKAVDPMRIRQSNWTLGQALATCKHISSEASDGSDRVSSLGAAASRAAVIAAGKLPVAESQRCLRSGQRFSKDTIEPGLLNLTNPSASKVRGALAAKLRSASARGEKLARNDSKEGWLWKMGIKAW